MTGQKFRWRFYDADTGEQWTAWHMVDGPCATCCCDGPIDGEHRQQCVVYDEPDDYLPNFQAHTRLDPRRIESWRTVEWA